MMKTKLYTAFLVSLLFSTLLTDAGLFAQDMLIEGGVKIGTTDNLNSGTIRWSDSHLQLTQRNLCGDNSIDFSWTLYPLRP